MKTVLSIDGAGFIGSKFMRHTLATVMQMGRNGEPYVIGSSNEWKYF